MYQAGMVEDSLLGVSRIWYTGRKQRNSSRCSRLTYVYFFSFVSFFSFSFVSFEPSSSSNVTPVKFSLLPGNTITPGLMQICATSHLFTSRSWLSYWFIYQLLRSVQCCAWIFFIVCPYSPVLSDVERKQFKGLCNFKVINSTFHSPIVSWKIIIWQVDWFFT